MSVTSLVLYRYTPTDFLEEKNPGIAHCKHLDTEAQVNWLHIVGTNQTDLLNEIASAYGIHPLVIEDINHTRQRPKMESYNDFLFITLRHFKEENLRLESQQVSFILKNNLLISVLENETPVFEGVIQRISKAQGQLRSKGEDYLLYALMDAVIDSYFDVLEQFSGQLEILEEDIAEHAAKKHLLELQHLKRSLIFFKKYTIPVRELISNLDRNSVAFFDADNKPYLRDLLDHSFRVNDSVETHRDVLTSLMDLYHSMLNNRMNEVMKTLTLISSFFIPLTFIVGVYGMNFDVMPELRWEYGYAAVWALMIAISLGLFLMFKKRKWF
jgi:magnesium transporter